MKEFPLISVVMSVHNAVMDYLKEAVQSILKQTYENFEFIIVNDINSEPVNSYLKEISKDEPRIRLIHNEYNIGLTRSLIKGVGLAKGKYIARQDADDISKPERFQIQVAKMEDDGDIILLGTWSKDIDLSGAQNPHCPIDDDQYLKKSLFFMNHFSHPSVMFRLDAYYKVKGYNPRYRTGQDYDLWFRMAQIGKFGIIEKFLVQRRVHGGAISASSKVWGQLRSGFWIRYSYIDKFGGMRILPILIFSTVYSLIWNILPKQYAYFLTRLLGKIRPNWIY